MTIWKRLIREAQNIVENFKDPMRYQSEKLLFDFTKKEDCQIFSVFTDALFGGSSTASLTPNEDGFMTFSGTCSKEIKDPSKIKRSGFCGIRSNGDGSFLDMSEFQQLELKIRGTRHSFLTNIRTYDFISGDESRDVWGDDWHVARLPLRDFVLTWKGKVVPEVREMNTARIMSIGITRSLTAKEKASEDFYLDIAYIKAIIEPLD